MVRSMLERWLAAAILVSTALGLAGCCPLFPTGKAGEVWVREEHAGKEVNVQVGQILVVDLEAAPTTGYRWEVEGLDGALLRQVGEPEFESKAPLLMGAPAQQRIRLEVIGVGRALLSLVYRRSWETGKPPAKSFALTVVSGR